MATAPPADFRVGIWAKRPHHASSAKALFFIDRSPTKEDEIRVVPVFLLAMLAAPAAAPSPPILVTGRPWAPFISPMGEPFRAHSRDDDTLADWFYQVDRNRDGVLTADEMLADADRFFATLDTDHDGEIDPDELSHYEWDIAPYIQVMSKTMRDPRHPQQAAEKSDDKSEDEGDHDRRHDRQRMRDRTAEAEASLGIGGALQGAARYSLLNIPEPVASADADFNRGISREEFRQAAIARFQLLDSAHQGKVTLAELEARLPAPSKGHHPKLDDKAVDTRVGNSLPTGP